MPSDVVRDIVLAMLQGFTEVLPISSSGHLAVYGSLLGQEMSFDQVILFHLGTFVAISYFYRKDIVRILSGGAGWRMPALMLLSFAVTAVLGFAVEETLSNPLVQQPQSVAVLWLVNGLVVILVGYPSRSGSKQMGDLGVREYVIIGLAQGIAALPGISRLGLTLGAGLLQKMTWPEALKLSFLLSLPTILAANLLEAVRYLSGASSGLAVEHIGVSQLIVDAVLLLPAAGCGLLALGFLNRFLGRRLLVYFGVYCLAAGSFFWLYLQVL